MEMYKGILLYGVRQEAVPPLLNEINMVIYIDSHPYDERALLFRDMELGDKLLTLDAVNEYKKGLEILVKRLDGKSRAMLKESPHSLK